MQIPISYRLFCEEGDEVSKSEIAYGYKLKGHEYLVFDKKEIDSAKPVYTKLIELDKFVNFFQADPHYFERTFLLNPNNSAKPCLTQESPGEDRPGSHREGLRFYREEMFWHWLNTLH